MSVEAHTLPIAASASDVAGMPGEGRAVRWRRAALWLCLLAPVFFASYGLANQLAAQRPHVGSVVFGWEQHIPFLPWTIVPYWSIDLFYALAPFVAATCARIDTLGRRLLTAQAVAVACFISFPLAFSVERPAVDGLPGILFGLLEGFDKPYNQAPSLHIALLVILWAHFADRLSGARRWLVHGWSALIAVSVLTTYQHHFVDVPTGALLGLACLWAWPDEARSPLAARAGRRDPRRLRLAALYGAGAAALGTCAFILGGAFLWLLWPAVSLGLVAAAYAWFGPAVFQKGRDGRMSTAVRLLLAPYRLGVWLNSRLWTRRAPQPVHVADDVWLGRFPGSEAAADFASVVDLTAEMGRGRTAPSWHAYPCLDLVTPEPDTLRAAADAIEEQRPLGPVLVACALGRSRSAAAVAAWLLRSRRATDAESAVARLACANPRIKVSADSLCAIAGAAETR